MNKICTKLMTVRLGCVLPRVLSLSQSGFVPGRLLSDNVLLAQELIDSLESRRADVNVVFKLDMAKAYDRVSWEFLYHVLQQKGFPQCWINLVANAVSNCWFSVFMNGEHAGFFHSPVAYGMETLSLGHYLYSLRITYRVVWIEFLRYTRRCIIRRRTMELLRDFLRAYQRVSGQMINDDKSSFIVGRQSALGVGNDESLTWRRLALIKSVLQATPLHLLQVILPPKSVFLAIERIFNGFFWGSYNGRRHIHWSSWEKVCFPVAEGGLGIRGMADYVRAFSMKLWWRFRLRSSLWSEFLHGRYCRNLHPTLVPYNRNHSAVWHLLCHIRDVAEPFVFWTLGHGSVSFWHDNWFGEKPLAQIVHMESYTLEPVHYYWHKGEWNVPKIFRTVPTHTAYAICQIPIAVGHEDKIV
ncbi:UNVERIFIED_CONTAM: hypothetical protein Sradi_1501200 [Sesamum radiatum]|uniref:Reverse transcriptase domain-containing protein n=1 Tax=Sesamum radiatum TaxID=300843 RepID=A0AAW2U9H9_SESRA